MINLPETPTPPLLNHERISQDRYAVAFNASPAGISITTLDEGRILDINESYLRMIDAQREDVLGRTTIELGIAPDPEVRERVIENLRQSGAVRNLEIQYHTRSGELRYALTSLEIVQIDGQPCVLSQAYDITQRKQAEELLKKLSTALEQTADNILITDRQGVIEYVNPAFEQLTGYTRQEVLGKTPRLLKSGTHPLEFYQRLWSTILAGETFRGEFYNCRKNGELYVEDKTISPLRDNQGIITHFVSTSREVTERARQYHSLEQQAQADAREIALLYNQSELRSRELEALYRADAHIYRHLRLNQVLQALVDVVIDLLEADKASVQVWDASEQRLVVRAARGYTPEMIALMSSYAPGDGISGKVFLSGEAIAVEDARYAPPPADFIAEQEGIRSVLSVPITVGERIFGVFGMDYCTPRIFNADDKRLFLALAQRAAIAIENAQLYEQAQQAAILEERQRLARELHDSVTQLLYSLVLLSEAGRRFSAMGDLQQTEHHLGRLGETAQQALKEMRLMVYEMKPLALHQEGLVGTLQQRLDAVEKRSGVQTEFLVSGEIDLPLFLVEELYRIAQEALNNALKHASASKIELHLSQAGGFVELEVHDNGRGFDLSAAGDLGGMGLKGMRERAEHIAGDLEVISATDEGTTVRIRVKINGRLTGSPVNQNEQQ